MRPLRIAYVINSVEGGGAALPVPAIVDVLRAEGAEVALFALTRRDGRALGPIEAAGIEVFVREGGERDHLAASRWLDGAVRYWRPTHLWTSLSRATLLGQIVGQLRRVPVVSWQHAAYLKPANLRLLRWRRDASALWVADSEAVERFARDAIGIAPDRLMRWPIFRADPQAPRAAPWRSGEPLRIGSLGRLHPVKGYDVLADALDLLAARGVAARVTIAGGGPVPAALRGRRLDFAGFTDRPRDFLAGLHLYLQPSRSEGFCVAGHEAMQAGVPVIASAVGQLGHSITPETGWLVPPGDPEWLAATLAGVLSAPERLHPTGVAARERTLAAFGPEAFAQAGRAVLARLSR